MSDEQPVRELRWPIESRPKGDRRRIREQTNGGCDVCRCGCHQGCSVHIASCCTKCNNCGRHIAASLVAEHSFWCRIANREAVALIDEETA